MISTVIPSRKEPHDTNTFLQSLVAELEKLHRGVPAFDTFLQEPFTVRASIAKSFADQAAKRKVLQFKGPESKKGCRLCDFIGKLAHTETSGLNIYTIRPMQLTHIGSK